MDFSVIHFIILLLSITSEINCVLWPCNTTEDCRSVESATCSESNLCQCPAGSVFSEDVSKCLKESLYGENCESSNQCSHMLTGSRCNRVCECAEGFTYIRSRCKELVDLHSICNEDTDCFFGADRESVICNDNKCKCADGYYERTENICRRKSMKAGDKCVVHQDCQGDFLECKNLVCAEKQQRRTSRDIGIQTIYQSIEKKNASTSIDRTSLFTKEKTKKAEEVKFGDQCNITNESCQGLSHSICIQGLCYCQKGYYPKNGLCKAELGELADTAELCEGEVYNIITKKCLCDLNRFTNNTLRQCLKPANAIGFSCTQHTQCTPFGAAYCTDPPKRCQCHSYADYDEAKQLCIPKKGLGSYCLPTEDATNECENRASNTVCSNNACVCKDKFIEVNGECKAGENAKCSKDKDCAMENAECVEVANAKISDDKPIASVCKCKSEFVYAKQNCLKAATEYNEECNESEQCKPLLGNLAKCLEEKCGCEEHLQYNSGKCNEKKALGEVCSRSSECFVAAEPENVECRNAVCECKFGIARDLEKQICRPAPKKNSSGRPSVLKVITLLLTTAAVLITSAAIKEAYY